MSVLCHPVRGRLAPSPTGYIHLGNAWAFLLAWSMARARNGQVVLRMEDIDPARSRPEYVDGILRDLAWLGLDWDEGPDVGGPYAPYTQSGRFALYENALVRLAQRGLTYPCFCTRKELRSLANAPHGPQEGVYPGLCRNLSETEIVERRAKGLRAAVRFRAPGAPAPVVDKIAGVYPAAGRAEGLSGPIAPLVPDDIPLRRSDGVYSYQLAVVVDDAAMHINQVVRGNDLLHCTPQQVQLFQALGVQPPQYAHIPLLCDEQGERLAKRHASLEVQVLRNNGARAEALIGYLAWRSGVQRECAPLNAGDFTEMLDSSTLGTQPVLLEADYLEKILKIS